MRFLTVVLVVVSVILVGCRPPENTGQVSAGAEGGVRVSLELAKAPAVGPAEVRVYLLGSDNKAVSGATVTVTGTMTHAGMVPIITQAVPAEGGLYRTEDFAFDMAGDWLLEADVTLPDGSQATDEQAVTVPGG